MKKTAVFLGMIFVSIITYYAIEIGLAYNSTPEIKKEFINDSAINLTIDELSNRQQMILIKVQDPNFWNHKGVEFSTPGSGWTTITQALAKWFYFHPFKPGIRKIKQTLLARFALHYQLSKQEQLLIFINHVWFQYGIKGFRNASNHFYQKDVNELTEDEFISLMAMPVSPKYYNILSNPENNRKRSNRIKEMLYGRYAPKGLFDIYYNK